MLHAVLDRIQGVTRSQGHWSHVDPKFTKRVYKEPGSLVSC